MEGKEMNSGYNYSFNKVDSDRKARGRKEDGNWRNKRVEALG